MVENFLLALGVSPETAQIDAEGIEHHVSAETLAAFERFLEAQQQSSSSTAEPPKSKSD